MNSRAAFQGVLSPEPRLAQICAVPPENPRPLRRSSNMVYRIEYIDHGGNVFERRFIEHNDDRSVIDEAHRGHVPGIGAGFDVWQDNRLVHKHRN